MKTWRDIEELADRKRLAALIEEEKTPLRIARKLGCSRESVKTAMRNHGLQSKKYQIKDSLKERLRL